MGNQAIKHSAYSHSKVASQYPTSEKSSPIARRDICSHCTSGLRSLEPVFGGLLCVCASEVRRYTNPGVSGPQAEGRPEGSKAKASTTASSVPLLHHEAHTQQTCQHTAADSREYIGMQVTISRQQSGSKSSSGAAAWATPNKERNGTKTCCWSPNGSVWPPVPTVTWVWLTHCMASKTVR